jgi:hypothetical protein
MGKPALGKGMKDLIAKNFGVAEQDPSIGEKKAKEELKVNIDRYHAQGYDTTLLKDLKGKSIKEMQKGIESFRIAVKKLNSAKTILRSLEGFGYTKEIETLEERLTDPSKADKVLIEVERLRDRAMTEHNIPLEKKETPRVKLPKSLKEQSEKLSKQEIGAPEAAEEDMDIDEIALDDMLSKLEGLSGTLSMEALEQEDDELLIKIKSWETEGFFVDRLVTLLSEDRPQAEVEIEAFEQGINEIRALRKRMEKMDLSGFEKQAEEIRVKFQYPHMSSEIKNELDEIDRSVEEALKASMPPEETSGEPEAAPEVKEEPVPQAPEESAIPEEDVKEEAPETPEKEASSKDEEVPSPVEDMTETSEEAPERIPDAETVSEFEGASLEEMMDKAKDAYRDGDFERSLQIFEEILNQDPDNSKARFMIRRLSQKK